MQLTGIEFTPNPNAQKFNVEAVLTDGSSKSFDSKADAEKDPLALALFNLEGVVTVFYLENFVSVSKSADADWDILRKSVSKIIENFDLKTMQKQEVTETPEKTDSDAGGMLAQINKVIDEKVRPALAGDGGGLDVVGLEDHTVSVRYQGACGTCPSSIQGTLVAIENLIKEEVDENLKVVAV